MCWSRTCCPQSPLSCSTWESKLCEEVEPCTGRDQSKGVQTVTRDHHRSKQRLYSSEITVVTRATPGRSVACSSPRAFFPHRKPGIQRRATATGISPDRLGKDNESERDCLPFPLIRKIRPGRSGRVLWRFFRVVGRTKAVTLQIGAFHRHERRRSGATRSFLSRRKGRPVHRRDGMRSRRAICRFNWPCVSLFRLGRSPLPVLQSTAQRSAGHPARWASFNCSPPRRAIDERASALPPPRGVLLSSPDRLPSAGHNGTPAKRA